MTSHGGQKTTRWNARQVVISFLSMQRNSEEDKWSFLGLGYEKSGIVLATKDLEENGAESQRKRSYDFPNRWGYD